MEEIELYLEDAKETMEGAIKHLIIELGKIRAGKATPQMLEGLQIDYYGSMTPIQNVATINTPDARTIAIRPFEKKIINDIERAIRNWVDTRRYDSALPAPSASSRPPSSTIDTRCGFNPLTAEATT